MWATCSSLSPLTFSPFFILSQHEGYHFTYFRLTEGDDPPVYFWEEGEGGLEASWQGFDSFSDFLRNEIRVYRIENRLRVTDEILAAKKQPRGRQLWNPTLTMEKFKYIQEVIVEFEILLAEFGGEVIPCTEKEVKYIESMLTRPYHLPGAYKEFLLYGGKKIARIFDSQFFFSYDLALLMLKDEYRDIIEMLRSQDPNAKLYPDIFILSQHEGYHFTYFRLTEGDDPPVYFWEEGEGGLEASWQGFDSFSDFLRNEIRVYRIENRPRVTDEILAAKKQPRGRQLWNPTRQEQAEGIEIDDLMFYLGIGTFDRLEKAATLSGLNSEQYLEELSGWQSRTVIEEGESEIRFFPPTP